MSVVKSFSVAGPVGIKIQLDVDAAAGTADSGDIEQDLSDLQVEIGEVARAGDSGALFLIDEMQNLDAASLSALCMAFHHAGQRELRVALAGAGLPTLPAMLRAATPYAPRLFSYADLARLAAPAPRALLVGPAALQEVSYDEDALELIIDQSGGYPFFLQEYGRVLWDEVEQPPITRSDVEAVADLVDDGLDRAFFNPAFELASDAEQRYLIGIAHIGDGPYRTAEAAEAAGYAGQAARRSCARD
jgi:hypothetical protein